MVEDGLLIKNKNIFGFFDKIKDGLFFQKITDNDFSLFMKLLEIAKQEQWNNLKKRIHDRTWFTPVNLQSSSIGLLLNKKEYIGYIVWTDKLIPNMLTTTQIFVIKKHRKKGYASILTEYWVEKFADKINEFFCVQDPNPKSIKILLRKGYVKEAENKIIGLKCKFIKPIG